MEEALQSGYRATKHVIYENPEGRGLPSKEPPPKVTGEFCLADRRTNVLTYR